MKTFKTIVAFVLIIAAISFGCIAINNLIFILPMEKTQIKHIVRLAEAVKANRGEVYILNGDMDDTWAELERQSDITKEMFLFFDGSGKMQMVVNKGIYEMLKAQNAHIELLEEKVQTLERRHLELLRAHAVLQKKVEKIK